MNEFETKDRIQLKELRKVMSIFRFRQFLIYLRIKKRLKENW